MTDEDIVRGNILRIARDELLWIAKMNKRMGANGCLLYTHLGFEIFIP